MKNCKEFITSGILELYVLGQTTPEEHIEVETMSALYPEVKQEILEISKALEQYALENPLTPDPVIKPFLMATIDYSDRMQNGEVFSSPPVLSPDSRIADYEAWISREDMVPPAEYDDIYAKILSYTPEVITAIVWLKVIAPQEVHDHEYEKFLVLEGTCDITIGKDVYSLKRGDYLSIPLYQHHHVTVTSSTPCKVILQRVAA